jgi:hypothetical protein
MELLLNAVELLFIKSDVALVVVGSEELALSS